MHTHAVHGDFVKEIDEKLTNKKSKLQYEIEH